MSSYDVTVALLKSCGHSDLIQKRRKFVLHPYYYLAIHFKSSWEACEARAQPFPSWLRNYLRKGGKEANYSLSNGSLTHQVNRLWKTATDFFPFSAVTSG